MPIYRFMDQNLGQGQSPDFKTWTQEFDFYFQELYDDQEFRRWTLYKLIPEKFK